MPILYSFTDLKVHWSIRTYFNVHPHLYSNAPRHSMMTFNLVPTFSNYSTNCHVLCISCWWIIYPLFFPPCRGPLWIVQHSKMLRTTRIITNLISKYTDFSRYILNVVASMQGEVGVRGWEGNTRLKPKGTRAKHLPLTWPRGGNDSWEFQFTMYSDGWQRTSFTYN